MKVKVNLHSEDGRYYFAVWCSSEDDETWEYDTNGECPVEIASDADAIAWAAKEYPGCKAYIVEQTA